MVLRKQIQWEKEILGVMHSRDPAEIDRVHTEITARKPRKFALELPEDYERRLTTIGFFDELATRLKGEGVEVIPIEDPELWDMYKVIEMAKHVSDGQITKKDLTTGIEQAQSNISPYSPPEENHGMFLFIDRATKAVGILESSTKDQVDAMWDDINEKREAHFTERINKTKPDVAVIGVFHAEKIAGKLKGYSHTPT